MVYYLGLSLKERQILEHHLRGCKPTIHVGLQTVCQKREYTAESVFP